LVNTRKRALPPSGCGKMVGFVLQAAGQRGAADDLHPGSPRSVKPRATVFCRHLTSWYSPGKLSDGLTR
jgi:hypothetical protein